MGVSRGRPRRAAPAAAEDRFGGAAAAVAVAKAGGGGSLAAGPLPRREEVRAGGADAGALLGGLAALLATTAMWRPARMESAVEQDEEGGDDTDSPQWVLRSIEGGRWPPVQRWTERHGVEAAVNPSGQSALSFAAEKGSVIIVRALLQASANAEGCDKQGLSVLLHAARQGHAPVVAALLGASASPERPADIFGNAPIHGAAGFGHVAVVRALLRARCDPNLRTGDVSAPESWGAQSLHEAPLHLACRPKPPHLELKSQGLVRLLLSYGASCCLQDDRGDTAAHLLVRKGDVGTLWLLLSRAAPELAELAAFGLRNATGRTAAEEAEEAPWAVKLALRLSPSAASLRQRFQGVLPADAAEGDNGEEDVSIVADGGAENESWRIYQARLEGGPALLPFEEGGDGNRRRRPPE